MAFVDLRITSLMAVLLLKKSLNSIIMENPLFFTPLPNG
jgi:hypothetical protein